MGTTVRFCFVVVSSEPALVESGSVESLPEAEALVLLVLLPWILKLMLLL